MLPEDERALFRVLERRELTLYPELMPPGFTPIPVNDRAVEQLGSAASWYMAAERLGAVIVHPIKRGPDRGMLAIEELPSPVFHYERSVRNEQDELVQGRLWAELEDSGDPTDRKGKPRGLRAVFDEVNQLFRKNWRRSEPKGAWVGPRAAEAWKRGELVLREAGHKGRTYGVWR